jgi:hypothetical protein
MKKNLLIQLILGLAFLGSGAHAAMSPVAVSIIPPVQFPPSDFSITGLRANLLYGSHRDVFGLDFGVVGNRTTQDFVGLGIAGGFNWTEGTTKIIGLQAAGVANVNTQKTDVYGVQIALVTNYNSASSSVTGLQLAAANISKHTNVYGVQAGIYNSAQAIYGFQIGLVNVAENVHGLQIGLINFHHKGLFVVSPIINFGW